MRKDFMVVSESVTEGHPDKLCDKISDAIIDNYLLQDPYARVRAQCAVSNAIIFIAARFLSTAIVDLSHVARKVIKKIGYSQEEFNANACSILTSSQQQPPEKQYDFDETVLTEEDIDKIAVKNQVTVFGFACDETKMLMPMPIFYANRLSKRLHEVRLNNILPYLEPEATVQVGVEYKNREPHRIHSIAVMATHKHSENVAPGKLQSDIQETVINSIFENEKIKPDNDTRIFVNPDGRVSGGPAYHSGLSGRKNAIDTYGEYCRNSGKALSGKDPLRIDRIGAYAARYAAKNIVAAGIAKKCEVLLSYSIGLVQPVSVEVETFGTGKLSDQEITLLVKKHFDFRLAGILKEFDLRRLPQMNSGKFYQHLAAYGHFGRTDLDLPWEKTDKAVELRSLCSPCIEEESEEVESPI